MALDNVLTGNLLNTANIAHKASKSTSNEGFLPKMSEIIDNGFQEAICSLGNFDITIPKGSLNLVNTERDNFALHIGTECARYWSEAIGFGSPEEKEIVSVENDASKIALPIADNIMNIDTKNIESPYSVFVECIYKEVKTIVWTIVCLKDDDSEVTFTGNVS